MVPNVVPKGWLPGLERVSHGAPVADCKALK